MKVHLMYENDDFNHQIKLTQQQDLIKDLELNILFDVMADKDSFIYEIVSKAMLIILKNPEEILYRQSVLKDCLKNPEIVRKLYDIATEATKRRREYWWGIGDDSPSSLLNSSIKLLQMYVERLKMLREAAYGHEEQFESKGFTELIKMLQEELDDKYLAKVQTHLNELKFKDGILISSKVGRNIQGVNYILHSKKDKNYHWLEWLIAPSLYIHEKDENGLRDLERRSDRAINNTANILSQSVDNVNSFFIMLRTELAFYLGCLNLYHRLIEKDEPVCFPIPEPLNKRKHLFKGLYDVCLSLIIEDKTVGNDVNADGKDMAIITGANQGGKSTFLRSIGQAQLMMQCGMFVPAEYFSANVCDGIFTHYKREEDATMKSGKLDEELARISGIVNYLRANSMVLFNESFASTNEREGSEIASQIVCALLEKRIKVFFVTHLYKFAHSFYEQKKFNTIFLRAERQKDGRRTFKVKEGEPLQTSYGNDLYDKIFRIGHKDYI